VKKRGWLAKEDAVGQALFIAALFWPYGLTGFDKLRIFQRPQRLLPKLRK
jgi:hypothetical protein